MGAALRNDLAPERFESVFSPNPEALSLHRERCGENGREPMGKLVPVDTVVGFYVHFDVYVRQTIWYSIRRVTGSQVLNRDGL